MVLRLWLHVIQVIHKNHKEFLREDRSIEHTQIRTRTHTTAHAEAYGKQCLIHLQTSIRYDFYHTSM